MIAANYLRGDVALSHWEDLAADQAFVIDVREPKELKNGQFEGAVNIPVGELRSRLDELPRDQEIYCYCGVGQRSYYANRILLQKGFQVSNLSGGYLTYKSLEKKK